MLRQRVFTNLSNVKTETNSLKTNKAIKRTLDVSLNKECLKKKNKSVNTINSNCIVDQNDENKEMFDPTLTIERKVKAIDIGSNVKEIDIEREQMADISEQEESQLNDQSFEANTIDFHDPTTYYCPPKDIPDSIEDFDKSQLKSIDSEPHYSADIFRYYREKEANKPIKKYMHSQPEITKAMRSVLVDWMVEVQESFELNHETLYLAIKLMDHLLTKEQIPKVQFQLVGATVLLIAAKFDERIPPAIEDFLYICDDAYTRNDVILMEMRILKAIDFDLCFAISYRFLRRYARCAKLSMETLTLARFILEMSLMEYEIIEEADSRVAAAALMLALRMKGQTDWNETLEYYSGYKSSDLLILMYRLNEIITTQTKNKTIRTKYSHKIFFEVANISPLPRIKPERM
ncbi:G2/mitotic-specific cyclin-B3-like [Oppia nitens]|uniref:G2/mitotic-specific cyclin-B3-like n=1 Tax=Oppia nitens TaxID=1686743 RepID=UPI0023DA5EB1|nr:G2/mitotic-specific cyclin-B3-like [Oppia nitens]